MNDGILAYFVRKCPTIIRSALPPQTEISKMKFWMHFLPALHSAPILSCDHAQVLMKQSFFSNILAKWCYDAYTWSAGIHFIHRSQVYLNNSEISVQLIGENDDALLCKTDLENCCGTPPNHFGEFYYPSGVQVPIKSRGQGFYRNRGKQEVRLHRRGGVITPTGRFRCQIPDASGDLQNIYIELVPWSK